MRVMIVEDSAAQRHVLQHLLQGMGYQVLALATGAVALAQPVDYDAVIADLHLPDMAGDQVLTVLQTRLGAGARLLCMTADDNITRRAFPVLRKPLRRAQVQQALAGKTVDVAPDVGENLVDLGRVANLQADLGLQTAQRLLTRFVAEADDVATRPSVDAMTLHHLAGAAALFGALALQKSLTTAGDAWRDLWPATRDILLQLL
jgi:CheY-like chemotaxis protein